jgi:hypothetical protein
MGGNTGRSRDIRKGPGIERHILAGSAQRMTRHARHRKSKNDLEIMLLRQSETIARNILERISVSV